jgi:hypothetical protein
MNESLFIFFDISRDAAKRNTVKQGRKNTIEKQLQATQNNFKQLLLTAPL